MSKTARFLAAVLVAVFAASSAAHAAAVTDMSLKMSMAAMDRGDMADCQDRPGDDSQTASCGQFCLTVLVALTTSTAAPLGRCADEVISLPTALPGGIMGPPDRHPPRTIRIG